MLARGISLSRYRPRQGPSGLLVPSGVHPLSKWTSKKCSKRSRNSTVLSSLQLMTPTWYVGWSVSASASRNLDRGGAMRDWTASGSSLVSSVSLPMPPRWLRRASRALDWPSTQLRTMTKAQVSCSPVWDSCIPRVAVAHLTENPAHGGLKRCNSPRQ